MDNIVLSLVNVIKENIKNGKYIPLRKPESELVRKYWREGVKIPLEKNIVALYTKEGTLIAKGYERVVIGDYGAYIEIDELDMIKENICVKKGQEYRINDERYSKNTKYHWLTAKDNSDVKIYFQQKTVKYADYKIGMYYVSPDEIVIK